MCNSIGASNRQDAGGQNIKSSSSQSALRRCDIMSLINCLQRKCSNCLFETEADQVIYQFNVAHFPFRNTWLSFVSFIVLCFHINLFLSLLYF